MKYNDEELDWLTRYYHTSTTADIEKRFPNRKVPAICEQGRRMGLAENRTKPWREEEKSKILDLAKKVPIDELHKHFSPYPARCQIEGEMNEALRTETEEFFRRGKSNPF